MEVDELRQTFDRCWFESDNFNSRMPKSSNSAETASEGCRGETEDNLRPMLSRAPYVHVRSMSDQLNSQMSFIPASSVSPDSVLRGMPGGGKLRSIPSGKEAGVYKEEKEEGVADAVPRRRRLVRRWGTRTTSKSLSELEFEEVKGFMDLGFVFSEEDKDSSLAEIIPWLHRLGRSSAEEDHPVSRPYLSESWEWWDKQRKEEERRKQRPMTHWDVLASGDVTDIKRSLRLWAHNVASVVPKKEEI